MLVLGKRPLWAPPQPPQPPTEAAAPAEPEAEEPQPPADVMDAESAAPEEPMAIIAAECINAPEPAHPVPPLSMGMRLVSAAELLREMLGWTDPLAAEAPDVQPPPVPQPAPSLLPARLLSATDMVTSLLLG